MSSTSSLPESLPPPVIPQDSPNPPPEPPAPEPLTKHEEQLQTSLEEALELQEGLKNLGRMLGLKSLRSSLQTEDKEVAKDYAVQRARLNSDLAPAAAEPALDPAETMDIMSARDVRITVQQAPPPPPPVAPPVPASGAGLPLGKLLLAGAAAASGVGLPIGGAMALQSLVELLKSSPAVVQPAPTPPTTDSKTIEIERDWRLGTPSVE